MKGEQDIPKGLIPMQGLCPAPASGHQGSPSPGSAGQEAWSVFDILISSWEQPFSAHSRQTNSNCIITTHRSFSSCCFQLFFWEERNSSQGLFALSSPRAPQLDRLQPHLTGEKNRAENQAPRWQTLPLHL